MYVAEIDDGSATPCTDVAEIGDGSVVPSTEVAKVGDGRLSSCTNAASNNPHVRQACKQFDCILQLFR